MSIDGCFDLALQHTAHSRDSLAQEPSFAASISLYHERKRGTASGR
jgi:organic hydroperoxide reductase OsmC/OhrA